MVGEGRLGGEEEECRAAAVATKGEDQGDNNHMKDELEEGGAESEEGTSGSEAGGTCLTACLGPAAPPGACLPDSLPACPHCDACVHDA